METRQGSSHIISEPSPERIMKSECFKFAPEMVKKKIVKKVQKPCCGKGPGCLSFLDDCPKYFFFSAA